MEPENKKYREQDTTRCFAIGSVSINTHNDASEVNSKKIHDYSTNHHLGAAVTKGTLLEQLLCFDVVPMPVWLHSVRIRLHCVLDRLSHFDIHP